MMKKNKRKEAVFTWGAYKYTDPYKVIEELFDFAKIGFYRNFIRDMLSYCNCIKAYNKIDAGNVIRLSDGVAVLLNACFAINKREKQNSLEIGHSDILNTECYSNWIEGGGIWDDFPRTISKEEFNNPLLALKRIFKYCGPQKWETAFREVVEFACGSYNDKPEQDSFLIYFQLTKLFEAAHLIYIREIAR